MAARIAAVEAEAPAEDAAVEAAPASDTPDQTETPADDDAETPDEGPKEGAEEEDDAGFIFIQTVRRRSKGTRAEAAGTDAFEGLQQVRRGEDAAEQGQRR